MDPVKIKLKFECVLLELLKSDYKLTDDTILEKLITHLSSNEQGSLVINVPFCTNWIQSSFDLWHQGKIKGQIVCFALRLLGIILQEESNFLTIKNQVLPPCNTYGATDLLCGNVLEHFQKLFESDIRKQSDFSIKFAFVKVLLCLLSHSSGFQWILSSGLWENVLKLSLFDSSIYVVRESRFFISRLLNEITPENNTEAKLMLTQVLDLLVRAPICDKSSPDWGKATSCLYLVSQILERAFHTIDPVSNEVLSVVVKIIREPHFNVLEKTVGMLKVTDDELLEEQLSKVAVILYILDIIKDGKSMDVRDRRAICLEILNIFNILISKGSVHNVLKLCVMCHNHWTYVRKLNEKEITEADEQDEIKKYRFEDQLLCLQLVPIFCCAITEPVENIKELYVHKLFHSTCHESQRLLFFFRDTIIHLKDVHFYATFSARYTMCLTCTLPMMIPFCVGCTLNQSTLEEMFLHQISILIDPENVKLMYLFRDSIVQKGLLDRGGLQAIASLYAVKSLFPRARAVLIFQSFVYVLKHFVVTDESNIKQGGWGGEFLRESHNSTLLIAILDGLAYLIRTYRITWRESVESLCLLSLALQLLDSSTLSVKVGLVVQALRLIQLCIENFMPPNLALLTNTINGTSFEDLGPFIYKRLHDPNWEVRDSSLEVLHILATISQNKYPLFQDLILENKLCGMVVHLALNDSENYVCASATKCLTAMVCVDRLWNEELQDKDLVNKMIGVLSGESEGVLRREASLLISQIFKHRKVTEDVLHKMCVTMSHVSVSDLHWEVKVNALNFWELFIEHSMNNQGMIDGEFPPVTFSKEHRKIVNLTPNVVRERLKKVLDTLSQSGCLHVLLAAIESEEDLEVVKRASQIITSLSKVLEQHDLLKHQVPSPSLKQSDVASEHKVLPLCESNFTTHSELLYQQMRREKSDSQDSDCSNIDALPLNEVKHSTQPIAECSNEQTNSVASILDLDPQAMGFAALEEVKSEMPSLSSHSLQEKVIDAILNDRDINLLASVYLGTEAELPGRQGPETKIQKTIRPLVVLSPDNFLKQLEVLQINEIVTERVRWIEDTGNHLGTLLDDMLIMRNVESDISDEECNAMDCY